MPGNYAHHTFGEKVISVIPDKYRKLIYANRSIYDLGVHGPDIFFYYKNNKNDPVHDLGHNIHMEKAAVFFRKAREVLKNSTDKEKALVYLIGFLSHFTLDKTAHPFVIRNTIPYVSELSHNKMETEFDAFLLRQQGKKPTHFNRTRYLKPSKEAAETIAPFYEIDANICLEVLKSQKKSLNILQIPAFILLPVLKSLKMNYTDLMFSDNESPMCQNSNQILKGLLNQAIEEFAALFTNLMDYLEEKAELSDTFSLNFELGE